MTLLKNLKTKKARGPDELPARVLKFCRSSLLDPIVNIFQRSLNEHIVPKTWKTSEIIPVPKNASAKEFNDFRPVALTSILMKCLEKLVRSHLFKNIQHILDPFQFAYLPNRCVEDATATLIHNVLQHAETTNAYSRVLFVDFSSAFNTIQPFMLM